MELVFTDFTGSPPFLPPKPDGEPDGPFRSQQAELNVAPALVNGVLGGVTDMHGLLGFGSSPVGSNPLDTQALELETPTAIWLADFATGGYRLNVTFAAEVLDAASAENAANYRITSGGKTVIPTAARLSALDDLANGLYAGRTVILTFKEALSTSAVLDASVAGSVLDMSTNSMPQVSRLRITANSTDTKKPTATAAIGSLPAQVTITFDEAMDETTVETLAKYTLANPAVPTDPTATPIAATLDTDGMTLYLQFNVPVNAGMTIAITAVKDINGQVIAANTKLTL